MALPFFVAGLGLIQSQDALAIGCLENLLDRYTAMMARSEPKASSAASKPAAQTSVTEALHGVQPGSAAGAVKPGEMYSFRRSDGSYSAAHAVEERDGMVKLSWRQTDPGTGREVQAEKWVAKENLRQVAQGPDNDETIRAMSAARAPAARAPATQAPPKTANPRQPDADSWEAELQAGLAQSREAHAQAAARTENLRREAARQDLLEQQQRTKQYEDQMARIRATDERRAQEAWDRGAPAREAEQKRIAAEAAKNQADRAAAEQRYRAASERQWQQAQANEARRREIDQQNAAYANSMEGFDWKGYHHKLEAQDRAQQSAINHSGDFGGKYTPNYSMGTGRSRYDRTFSDQ